MKTQCDGRTLRVSEIPELNALNSSDFRQDVLTAMPKKGLESIEIDVSQTRFVDSSGLGALFAVYKAATKYTAATKHRDEIRLSLINPRPPIRQLFELTQLHQLFEIVQRQ